MNRLLSSLFLSAALLSPAMAADLPRAIPLKAAPVVPATPYGLYWDVHGGGGFSSQQSELTLQGLTTVSTIGTPKQFATGVMVGGSVGYMANTAIGGIGAEIEANYDFTRSSFGCVPGDGCLGHSKNSVFLAQKLMYAPFTMTPMAWTGWAWAQGLQIMPVAGVAERSLDFCLDSTMVGGTSVCDTKWLIGWLAGVQARAPIGQSAFVKIEYDFVGYNQSVSHNDSAVFGPNTVLTNALKNDNEQRITVGVGGYFNTNF